MERVMVELIKHFSVKENVEIHLVLYGKTREIFYKIPDSVHLYKPNWEFNNDRRLLSTLRTLFWLRNKIKQISPDTILSFGEYWNSFVLLSLKGTSYKVYVSDRCQPDKKLGILHEKLRKWLYPAAGGMIAQTSKAKQIYERLGLSNNICVIGNPIRVISSNDDTTEREDIILTVGRLIDTKHHDRLVEIFDEIKINGWKLVIIGGNAIKQNGMRRLKKIIEQKELQDQVVLTGTVSNVEKYYLKSKIFAFTSSSEGFPNVIGEAMSAGLPVISYDCIAGPSEMIEEAKTGYLITLFDDKAYKEKLKMLMTNRDLRKKMGEASRERIKSFSASKISEKFYKFITESIKK